MKLIKPTVITDAMFTSSTAPEADFAAWAVGTAYVVGNKVIRTTHRIYECLADNTGNIPEDNLTGLTPKWLDIAPTNKWAMMDDVIGTSTTIASPLTVVLSPGPFGGLALMELVGKDAEITVKESPSGITVYNKTISLDGTVITSFYDWFFAPYKQLDSFVLTDLPDQFYTPEITISITATTGNVSCGVCKLGEVINIGGTEYGATSGVIDYSRKEKDVFGRYTIVERAFSKRANFKIFTDKIDYNRISRRLAEVRATPSVWIGSDIPGYEPLVIYGFAKDWSIDVAYPTANYCNLEIEGLI
ncbi:MAG: hypothetical protein U1D70_08125 [Methylobacter sp.]|nr:hypothetical protein [Methylobacter sp.]MDP2427960.1 hypothetical protein [Methylobacter sp.]MDP3054220.1 hypothetical protein [Methylobacter sp.]MDP3361135.1 hypothetical protein [Methylobacter sp.]MDZ4218977.1 hypothetical protein [Methylobacter sp.]